MSNKLIVGANGQLGKALQAQYPEAKTADIDTLNISDAKSVEAYDWSGIDTILNAAAYTNVDGAETDEGRVIAWQANATALKNLCSVARSKDITLIHVSTDYVFDGATDKPHTEEEPYSPLSVYGASKAAGDLLVSSLPKHYILRTSWVIGDGKNFVRSIMGLAEKNVSPGVVADQFGRLTFTSELVRAIDYFLVHKTPFGIYNVSNSGDVVSWADIARAVYKELGRNDLTVSDTTAAEYFAGKVAAARPTHSALSITKLTDTGFESRDWRNDLHEYIKKETQA